MTNRGSPNGNRTRASGTRSTTASRVTRPSSRPSDRGIVADSRRMVRTPRRTRRSADCLHHALSEASRDRASHVYPNGFERLLKTESKRYLSVCSRGKVVRWWPHATRDEAESGGRFVKSRRDLAE